MLQRSLGCQRNKLTFSKSAWYNQALKAVLPEKICLQRAIQIQCRATATLVSTIEDIQTEATPPIASKTPLVKPLEPLTTTKAAIETATMANKTSVIIVHNKYSTSYFRRCSSYKKYSGQPCQRLIKLDLSLPEKEHYYCFHHKPKSQTSLETTNGKNQLSPEIRKIIFNKSVKDFAENKGILETPNKVYDCWQLWIGDNIEPKHKTLIKKAMQRPLSDRDQPGYIYAYHLEDGPRVSQMEYAYFKIGRTKDPHRRMYQVTHACNYIPKIIELFPSFPKATINNGSRPLMSTNLEIVEAGKNKASMIQDSSIDETPKCPISHRVERLIHLELTSLYERAGFKCDECGSTHREWIRVNRRKHSNGSPMTDHELWMADIRPIVLKWIQFGVAASSLKS